jgi:REP element-mobilizing transposase RayT
MDQPPKYHKHIRLRGNDYRQGAYFVTLCTIQRQELFGQIVGDGSNALMELNDVGRIVDECWRAIPEHFPHARSDQMQIMPDHLHAILVLAPPAGKWSTQWVDATGANRAAGAEPHGPVPGSLGAIIAAFKSETTKRINRQNGITGQRLWQPGYHERAIRRQGGEYGRIAQYVAENPANWR